MEFRDTTGKTLFQDIDSLVRHIENKFEDEDTLDELSKGFNGWLGRDDFFGTERQFDPRGDPRD